jgi:drug/metabolite transporter (DMT)-like permease
MSYIRHGICPKQINDLSNEFRDMTRSSADGAILLHRRIGSFRIAQSSFRNAEDASRRGMPLPLHSQAPLSPASFARLYRPPLSPVAGSYDRRRAAPSHLRATLHPRPDAPSPAGTPTAERTTRCRMSHPIPTLRAYAFLAASMALVGSYVGLSKLLVASLPIFLLAWLRFAIAALAMPHWLRRRGDEPPLSAHDRRLLFWESFLGNFLFSIFMLYGVKLSSALAAGIAMAGIPAAVAVLSRIFLGERITPRVAWAIACAAGGIALLALARAGHAAAGLSPLGFALLMGAVICEASYVVIGKRLTGQVSPRRISAIINLWGLVLVTPLGLWQALSFDFAALPASIWALLLFYALAASVVTVWLWMKGLRHVPASRAGVFTVLLPTSAAAIGVLVLGETFTALHGAAFAMALAGVLLATWPGKQACTRPEGARP